METTDPRLQPTLVSLVQQRSPLLSYAARRVIECVLSSSFLEEPEAAAWMTALLDLPDHGDRATSVNTLECCAAILSSWREERHPELIKVRLLKTASTATSLQKSMASSMLIALIDAGRSSGRCRPVSGGGNGGGSCRLESSAENHKACLALQDAST